MIAFAGVCLSFAGAVRATTFAPATWDALTSQAAVILAGEVVGLEGVGEGVFAGADLVQYRFRIDECLRGEGLKRGAEVGVRLLDSLSPVGQAVEVPRLEAGERYILFLAARRPSGASSPLLRGGVFREREGGYVNELGNGGLLFDAPAGKSGPLSGEALPGAVMKRALRKLEPWPAEKREWGLEPVFPLEPEKHPASDADHDGPGDRITVPVFQ
ncbi:MAG: hypothetical protein RLY93_19720 [Sumerlaeia bacterium]